MMQPLRLLWRDPELRIVALALTLFGTLAASMTPYQSLLAVRIFGLTDAELAVVLAVASVVSVAGGVGIGILTDQTAARRRIAVWTASLVVAGNGLITLVPTPAVFVLVHAVILPLSASLFGQLFAMARLASLRHGAEARDAIMAGVRALFALPFILVLPIWAVVFANGAPLTLIYPVLGLVGIALVLLIRFAWPPDGHGRWEDRRSGLGLWASLRELGRPLVLSRVAMLGAISSGVMLYMIVLGLSFDVSAGRSVSDVALFAGIVAGLEVPVMLSMSLLLARMSRRAAIALGAAIYVSFLLLFPLLTPTALVWALVVPAAVGGGIILSLPIAYLQDLMGARAGAGGALIAVQKMVSDGIAASVFAIGTWIGGYGLAAVLGAVVMAIGSAALLWADRDRPRGAPHPSK